MKQFIKYSAYFAIIPLLIGLLFFSNIKGYYRFKSYCENEGGLRVYEKLERNVGWWAKDKYDARAAALLDGVGFVRYTDKGDGKTYDIKYIGGDPQEEKSFEKLVSDKSKSIIYVWKDINEPIKNELRLMRYGEQILDINDKIQAYYYIIGYQKLDPSHTFLGTSSETYCFNKPAKSNSEHSGWLTVLSTAFKN